MAEPSPNNQVIAQLAAMASEKNNSYKDAERFVVKFHDSRFAPLETLKRIQTAGLLPRELTPETEDSAAEKLRKLGVDIMPKAKSFPSVDAFISPVLQSLADGESKECLKEKSSKLSEEVAEAMMLSESLRSELVAKQSYPKYVSQTYWACHKLEGVGLLKRTDDNLFAITEAGEAFLAELIADVSKEKLTKSLVEKSASSVPGTKQPELKHPSQQPPKPYTLKDLSNELFIDQETLEAIRVTVAEDKKNLILCGPPGVGKTFAATRIAYALIGAEDDSRVQLVQFHQAYSYEDFVQGIRPASGGLFVVKPGAFFDFCEKARADGTHNYYFIIDEINRGNLSKILGESMMLIERDKRKPRYAIRLTYQEENDTKFFVPDNVYIIGMMNTADRSLALVDYALRRRFSFIELAPGFRNANFRQLLASANVSDSEYTNLVTAIDELNQAITDDPSLGSGFRIGHSYFCNKQKGATTDAWLHKIARYEIRPMLAEYWFDEPEKAQKHYSDFCTKLGLKP
jgi:5-methylcytosine-specific restriction protein B